MTHTQKDGSDIGTAVKQVIGASSQSGLIKIASDGVLLTFHGFGESKPSILINGFTRSSGDAAWVLYKITEVSENLEKFSARPVMPGKRDIRIEKVIQKIGGEIQSE